jgi:hypothetical protein
LFAGAAEVGFKLLQIRSGRRRVFHVEKPPRGGPWS